MLKTLENRKSILNDCDDKGNTMLHLAVIKGDTSIFKILMHYHKLLDLKLKNDDGDTVLSLAYRLPNVPDEIKTRLMALKMSVDPHCCTKRKRTEPSTAVLRKALQSSDLPKVKRLISSGANINEVDKRGLTTLHSFATDLVNMAVQENTVWDLFSPGYIEVFKFVVHETEADVTIKTSEGQSVLELMLHETFRHHHFRKAFYNDIAILIEPILPKMRMHFEDEGSMYICIFRAFFVGIKGNCFAIVRHCIENYYDETHNASYYGIIQRLINLFGLNEHRERYILCLLLHDAYENVAQDLGFMREQLDYGQPAMFEQLQTVCKTLARTNYRFEERLETFVDVLLGLKLQGYHLERTNVIEALAISFVNENISAERAKRIFALLEAVFEQFNIPFNNILISVLERVPNFMWHILKHTYLELKPIQLLLPFCSGEFYSVSTLFFTVLYNESFSIDPRFESNSSNLLTLCEHQKLEEIENQYVLNPLSLTELCRVKIRKEIHRESRTNKEFIRKIMSLPLPELIQKYLRYMMTF